LILLVFDLHQAVESYSNSPASFDSRLLELHNEVVMIKSALILSTVLLFAACGNKVTAPVTETADSFTVLSESPDPATKSITVNIRIDGPLSEASAKAAAETTIARYRNSYSNVTVRSFLQSSRETDLPYSTSVLQNGMISHKINPMVAPQKIPTH